MNGNINRNDLVISSYEELLGEIDFDNFFYKDYFSHICNLNPNINKEKIDIEEINGGNINKRGLVYVFVIEGKILKIGHTITGIKERIQSYNCGKQAYRDNGTCSTTNYFILQSILKINKKVNVYGYYPEQPHYNLFGLTYSDTMPPTKKAENIIINDFLERYNKKPIGCTQT